MNKSMSISLGGLSFFIEEDAFHKLQKYLEDVKTSLETGEDDTAEILKDVEARIAELFKEWLGNYRQVVDMQDIDKMIGIMGTPEQYQTEGIEEDGISNKSKNSGQSKEEEGRFYQRQLFRDTDDKMIAGVCSGLAHFFGTQPIWIRLGAILSLLFSGWIFAGLGSAVSFAYIILWIVMPKAVTTSDKLKMKGKPVNFDSIKEHINKEEISEQAGKIKNNISKASSEVGDFFEALFTILIKVATLFIGIVFVITAISWIASYFICSLSLSLVGSSEYINLVSDSSWHIYVLIALSGIVVLIPSLFLLLLGLRLITKKRVVKTTRTAIISLCIVWLISAIATVVMGINSFVLPLRDTVKKTTKLKIPTSSDTLNIIMKDYDLSHRRRIGINIDRVRFTEDSMVKMIRNNLEVKQSMDSGFYLEIKTFASGEDNIAAQKNLSKITYKYKVEGNNLNLDTYISMPKKDTRFRNQRVKLVLYVPQEKYINTHNLRKISSYDEDRYIDIYHGNNSNKLFKFVDGSLKCLNCRNSDRVSCAEHSE
ncbi:MAG: PspC domain-containing protein [Flavobacteriaceae bacterium]|jgi:phage shock protein PspC (stress-responsive transcriptional regulator)|nr:PspC domain-containing protein [Flavobacteriaceae bacterium]